MRQLVEFVVHGVAQTRGSKRSYVPVNRHTGQPYRRNGRIVVSTVDDNPKSKEWMRDVRHEAGRAMAGRAPTRRPVRLCVTIEQVRPRSHYGTGRNAHVLRVSAPAHPTARRDLGKMVRAIEDALTGVVYADDVQIVQQVLCKRYAASARVMVSVFELEETAAETAAQLREKGDAD